ncbi:TetR/AcrR family transcriptional regulator [Sneathiella aquimaris]|uniref:TetR/AcrR family transcriptional regulator n=1 Tax=Sneathiella aquimaris TaxID=2599305 RepID=UPI00146AE588|nr:TetR/AcrR family transcriptional regulator [Sneathiella aquimaris]
MRNPERTKEKLLNTAIHLVSRSSYHEVGVNEICRSAGVTKGAFYHHFDSKADLYYQAGKHHWDVSKPDFDRITSAKFTPQEHLQNLVDMIMDRHLVEEGPFTPDAHSCTIFKTSSHVNAAEPKVIQCAEELSAEIMKHHTLMIRGLQRAGMLAEDADPERVARLLYHFIQGVITFAPMFHNDVDLRRDLIEGIYRVVGLRKEYQTIL